MSNRSVNDALKWPSSGLLYGTTVLHWELRRMPPRPSPSVGVGLRKATRVECVVPSKFHTYPADSTRIKQPIV